MSELGDRRVVASISGGKDSAAMSLHLRELGIEHDRVFCDTGWEHPLTYEYLRGELTRVILRINPGGSVQAAPLPGSIVGLVPGYTRRLLSRADCHRVNEIWAEACGIGGRE